MPRSSSKLSAERLREWARGGAEAALRQLRAEIIAIERTFPELALPKTRRAVGRTLIPREDEAGRCRRRPGRRFLNE